MSRKNITMIAPVAAGGSKEGASSAVTPKSSQSNRPNVPLVDPNPPQPATEQISATFDTTQPFRISTLAKMFESSTSRSTYKTLSTIVKVKRKKDNGLPVAWRKELNGTRPGSAQARLETIRAALQKEVDEQNKAKATSSIANNRSVGQKSPEKKHLSSPTSTSKSTTASVPAVAANGAIPKNVSAKPTEPALKISPVKQTSTASVGTVIGKLENSFEMDVDGAELNSPKPADRLTPAVRASSSYSRYSAPARIPDRSLSNRLDKPLSSIVKVKHRKESGFSTGWRKELYGTPPGSAQARLENLQAALQKEAEEQKKAKATSNIPIKCSAVRESPAKERMTTITSITQSSSASSPHLAANRAIPVEASVKHTNTVPEVQQTSTVPVAVEDCFEMDVDESNSPEPADPFPTTARQSSSKSMEYDSFVQSNMQACVKRKLLEEVTQEAKKRKAEETMSESQKVAADLKTKYTDGLSAFESYFYCVIDTNIFIENYNDFQGFLSKKYSGSQPILVVPFKVLHELDVVKHRKPQLGPKITTVVKFLHQMLRAKDARVKGQHPWDDTIELMPVLSPDDSIINCALQVQSVADSGNVKVVLVSNDCNMLTKALVANLSSCTMEELQMDYKF